MDHLSKQPPRVVFRNNDIYMVNSEESDPYEEPQEQNVRVFYKLKVNKDPTSKNMPHKEDFDDDNVTNTILYLPQVHWGYYQTLIWSHLAMG